MKRNYLLLVCIYILTGTCFAQEVIVPLQFNPVIKSYIAVNGQASAYRSQAVGDTLDLPFEDDFSDDSIYPSSLRWEDNKVFINSDFGRNMPTVGVATFDGLDELGNAYVPGSTGSGRCDELTSKPLHLHTKPNGNGTYALADSLYISFFYEKKGYGDAPDVSDSLVLEFYRPDIGTWTREWFLKGGITGTQDQVFTRVDVKITNANYLQDGFQLKFHNYGNLSGSLDHWHIDYVRVYELADSTVIDQAFIDDRAALLSSFTSIPWKHYKAYPNKGDLIPDNDTVSYTIYQTTPNAIYQPFHETRALDGTQIGSFVLGSLSVPANSPQTFGYPINYIYPTNIELTPDSSYFDVIDYIGQNQGAGETIHTNDTIKHRQEFYNYYSYDDGTCELGYDLVNATNGMVAMRFDMLQADTLRGVKMFFAQQNADVSNKLITLKVWEVAANQSIGNVLLQITNKKPDYVDSINGFATYYFNMSIPVTSFYIGFQQISPDGLHLGFDRNTTTNSRMFYNTSGTWSQVSVLPGTFMIRPLVGDAPLVGIHENLSQEQFSIYPNPASDRLYINSKARSGEYDVIISDVTGREVYRSNVVPVDVSFLSRGIYTVQLRVNDVVSKAEKLIISR